MAAAPTQVRAPEPTFYGAGDCDGADAAARHGGCGRRCPGHFRTPPWCIVLSLAVNLARTIRSGSCRGHGGPRTRGAAIATALVTALVLHMVAPRTCLGTDSHPGLDAHLRQVGNVSPAAIDGVCDSVPLGARLARGLVSPTSRAAQAHVRALSATQCFQHCQFPFADQLGSFEQALGEPRHATWSALAAHLCLVAGCYVAGSFLGFELARSMLFEARARA